MLKVVPLLIEPNAKPDFICQRYSVQIKKNCIINRQFNKKLNIHLNDNISIIKNVQKLIVSNYAHLEIMDIFLTSILRAQLSKVYNTSIATRVFYECPST